MSSTRALVYRNWTNISPTVGTSAAMLLYAVSTTLDGSTILAVGAGGAVYYTSCTVLTTTSGGKPAPTSSCLQVTSLNTVYNINIRKLTLLHVHFYMPPSLTPFSPHLPLLIFTPPPHPAPSVFLQANWARTSATNVGTTSDLNCVSVGGGTVNVAVTAIAAGAGATVLKTVNGGVTWTSLSAAIQVDPHELSIPFILSRKLSDQHTL